MCGIVGARSFSNKFKISTNYITRMRDAMAHRGPDGGGVWVGKKEDIGLGHRRLSIIDLSESASQPMFSPDRSVCIIFNGEIYNHGLIRKQLEKEGVKDWVTHHSDTEVILNSYLEWGIDCFQKFNGMFACAIWDERTDDLWLIRDRIGIKPLYYSLHNNRITFASEIKALLLDPEQPKNLNKSTVSHYLAFICSPGPETLFDGIKKLKPGHLIKINSDGEIVQKKWYNVWDRVNPENISLGSDLFDQIEELLSESVELQKISDVPVGVFLSGGVDSSANAALFNKVTEKPLCTFSIGYEGENSSYVNELPQANEMAKRVGSRHFQKVLSQETLIEFLPRMIHLQDEPIADPVCVPIYYLSKMARENGVKVCQVGEGADELFCGYTNWLKWQKIQSLFMKPRTESLANISKKFLRIFGYENTRLHDAMERASNNYPVFWSSAQGPTKSEQNMFLGHELLKEVNCNDPWDIIKPIWQNFNTFAPEKSALNWMTYMDLSLRLPELLLMRVDKMSMGASLEARVPFLDHRFIELVLSIPEKFKLKGAETKYLLKQSLRDHVPREILDRPKRGFGVPVDDWIEGKLGKTIELELKKFCTETGYFNFDAISKLMQSKSRVRVWYLFNFALWHRHFIQGERQENLSRFDS